MKKKEALMKKTTILGIISLLMLTSCGGGAEIKQPIGDGSKQDDDVCLRYSMPSTIKSGDKITFSIQMEKDAPQEEVLLGLSRQDPLFSDAYTENILFSVPGDVLAKTINGQSHKVEHVFKDVSSYFEKTTDKGSFFFVFHRKDWSKSDVTSYSSTSFDYSFDGEKVQLFFD